MPEVALDFVLDPTDASFLADPYATYERIRARGPVVRVPGSRMWLATGHADVQQVLSNARFVKQMPEGGSRVLSSGHSDAPLSLLELDPPAHTRIRAMVNRAFTPRVVEGLRERIEATASALIAAMRANPSKDLVRDLAFPLPATVIAELLGVPAADRERFGGLSRRLALILDSFQPQAVREDAAAALGELRSYLGDLVARQGREGASDLVAGLIAAEQEEEGKRIDRTELVSLLTLLLAAGHETTTNLIGVGTYSLLRERGRWEWLGAHPDAMGTAVEELLRYVSPVQRDGRIVAEDLDLGGQSLRRGDFVLCMVGAANRDPAVFDRPNELVLDRSDNRHLAFGRGIHFCLGAPLARLEAQIVFRVLTQSAPTLALAGDPVWSTNSLLRSLRSLPVAM